MGGNLHAAAACLNAGDRVLIEDGIARITPLRAIARAGLPVTERVGSGNLEMPCWRMHFEILSIWAFVFAKPGSSLAQAAFAALNEGEDGLVTEPEFMGTPCSRMHRLKARTAWLRDGAVGLLEGPQAAIVSAEPITTMAIAARWPWRLVVFMPSFLSFGSVMCAERFYRSAYNRSATEAVTPLLAAVRHPQRKMRLTRKLVERFERTSMPARSVRLRLTALYGSLFLLCGAGLLAITYLLVRHTTHHLPRARSAGSCRQAASGRSGSLPALPTSDGLLLPWPTRTESICTSC